MALLHAQYGGPHLIGVIGGTGLYAMDGFTELKEITVDTPYGSPSGPIRIGARNGMRVAFLPRHGPHHTILPTEVNYAANIYALKLLGVKHIISLSAVGSLKEHHKPMDMVLINQFIDRTFGRQCTFFGNGLVAHLPFAEPLSAGLAGLVHRVAQTLDLSCKVSLGGTYVCINGPMFSTRAESNVYRKLYDADVVGMTNLTEAKLAREAEIAYATVAMVTDYDCWHESEESVSVEVVSRALQQNAANAAKIVLATIDALTPDVRFPENTCLDGAIVTAREHIPTATLERLTPIVGRAMGMGRD